MDNFEICFNSWAGKQKEITQKILELVVDMNENPDDYSEAELLLYGGIEPEDYQVIMNKAMNMLKLEIKDELEKFLKQGR